MSRSASWFATKNGRRFTHWCVGATALTVFGNQIAAYGPFLDKLKDIFQVYKFEKPRPLAPKMNAIVKQVLHDCNLEEEQKRKLKFFYAMGLEVFHAGGIESPWGAIIGIPFPFEDIKDIDFSEIKIVGKETVDWIIDGHDLINALTMSDNAKKFALMREIYSCNFSNVVANAGIGAVSVIASARLAQTVNAKTNALGRLTLGQRSARYIVCYGIGYLFYRLLRDPLKHILEGKADMIAAETGMDYLNGGIEYYEKCLLKNKALTKFSSLRFGNAYDEKGNENYFLLAPKFPISKRLDILRDKKKEMLGKTEIKDVEEIYA